MLRNDNTVEKHIGVVDKLEDIHENYKCSMHDDRIKRSFNDWKQGNTLSDTEAALLIKSDLFREYIKVQNSKKGGKNESPLQ